MPSQYCDGEYCSFLTQKNQECLDIPGPHGAPSTKKCDGRPDQRWRFISSEWVTPDSKWIQVGCNMNGPITHTITNEVNYAHGISVEESQEISNTFKAGCNFLGSSMTATASFSMAANWEASYSSSVSNEFACQHYDSGEQFTDGCMWQLQVETSKTVGSDGPLVWNPQIIRCTKNEIAPQCPPFTKCSDASCTKCVDTVY